MRRYLIVLLLGLSLSVVSWSQETDPPADSSTEDGPAANTPTDGAEDELEVEDESYLDTDEKDFKPSEEIPTDQSIPFPTDI